MAKVETMSSTTRAFQMLDLLAQPPSHLGRLTNAGELEMSPATAHRMPTTLCTAGYVERETDTKRYRVNEEGAVGGDGVSRWELVTVTVCGGGSKWAVALRRNWRVAALAFERARKTLLALHPGGVATALKGGLRDG